MLIFMYLSTRNRKEASCLPVVQETRLRTRYLLAARFKELQSVDVNVLQRRGAECDCVIASAELRNNGRITSGCHHVL